MADHVFISHSSADREVAMRIAAVLEKRGIRVWIAPRDILPGTEYAVSLIEAIEQSRAVLFVVSEHLNASHQVPREAERAVYHDIPLVPVRIADVKLNKSLEYFLSSAHWFDAFPGTIDDHVERLAGSLNHLLQSISAPDANKEAPALGLPLKPVARKPGVIGPPWNQRWLLIGGLVALLAIAAGTFFLLRRTPQTQIVRELASPVASPTPTVGASPATVAVATATPIIAPTIATAPSATPGWPKTGENFVAQSVSMPMTWVPPLDGWVGTYEVTQEQFARAGEFVSSRYPGAKRPADSVSWNDAMLFCVSLNRMEGGAGRLPPDYDYTLPTDDQWKTFVGDSGAANAVFGRTEAQGTAEVGTEPPNVFGLYDVIGNVWEWTRDWHPKKIGKERALRGGSFASRKGDLMFRDAHYSGSPTNRYHLYGFRVVLVKKDAQKNK